MEQFGAVVWHVLEKDSNLLALVVRQELATALFGAFGGTLERGVRQISACLFLLLLLTFFFVPFNSFQRRICV